MGWETALLAAASAFQGYTQKKAANKAESTNQAMLAQQKQAEEMNRAIQQNQLANLKADAGADVVAGGAAEQTDMDMLRKRKQTAGLASSLGLDV